MNITFQQSSLSHLPKYVDLYRACFPKAAHLTLKYLDWLYGNNPAGSAIGADALFGDEVIGQVIAVPGCYKFRGQSVKGLLAVNVAVHPKFQGRHLFKRLGLQMCEYGTQAGYSFVIGIANAAATPGWVRHMDFQLVSPLEARIGIGDINLRRKSFEILSNSELYHLWGTDTLDWRLSNPLKNATLKLHKEEGWGTIYTASGTAGLSAIAETPLEIDNTYIPKEGKFQQLLPHVFLGLIPKYRWNFRYSKIPDKIKPSPLNLIFKSLKNSSDRVDPESILINYLDFDAF